MKNSISGNKERLCSLSKANNNIQLRQQRLPDLQSKSLHSKSKLQLRKSNPLKKRPKQFQSYHSRHKQGDSLMTIQENRNRQNQLNRSLDCYDIRLNRLNFDFRSIREAQSPVKNRKNGKNRPKLSAIRHRKFHSMDSKVNLEDRAQNQSLKKSKIRRKSPFKTELRAKRGSKRGDNGSGSKCDRVIQESYLQMGGENASNFKQEQLSRNWMISDSIITEQQPKTRLSKNRWNCTNVSMSPRDEALPKKSKKTPHKNLSNSRLSKAKSEVLYPNNSNVTLKSVNDIDFFNSANEVSHFGQTPNFQEIRPYVKGISNGTNSQSKKTGIHGVKPPKKSSKITRIGGHPSGVSQKNALESPKFNNHSLSLQKSHHSKSKTNFPLFEIESEKGEILVDLGGIEKSSEFNYRSYQQQKHLSNSHFYSVDLQFQNFENFESFPEKSNKKAKIDNGGRNSSQISHHKSKNPQVTDSLRKNLKQLKQQQKSIQMLSAKNQELENKYFHLQKKYLFTEDLNSKQARLVKELKKQNQQYVDQIQLLEEEILQLRQNQKFQNKIETSEAEGNLPKNLPEKPGKTVKSSKFSFQMTFLLEKMSVVLRKSINNPFFNFRSTLKKVMLLLMNSLKATQCFYNFSRKPELGLIFDGEYDYKYPEMDKIAIYAQLRSKNLMKKLHKLQLGQIITDLDKGWVFAPVHSFIDPNIKKFLNNTWGKNIEQVGEKETSGFDPVDAVFNLGSYLGGKTSKLKEDLNNMGVGIGDENNGKGALKVKKKGSKRKMVNEIGSGNTEDNQNNQHSSKNEQVSEKVNDDYTDEKQDGGGGSSINMDKNTQNAQGSPQKKKDKENSQNNSDINSKIARKAKSSAKKQNQTIQPQEKSKTPLPNKFIGIMAFKLPHMNPKNPKTSPNFQLTQAIQSAIKYSTTNLIPMLLHIQQLQHRNSVVQRVMHHFISKISLLMASENLSQLLARLKVFLRQMFRAEDVAVMYFDALQTKLYTISPQLSDSKVQTFALESHNLKLGQNSNKSSSKKSDKNSSNLNYLDELDEDYLISLRPEDKHSVIYKVLNQGEMYVNLDVNLNLEDAQKGGKDLSFEKELKSEHVQKNFLKKEKFRGNFCGKVDEVRSVAMMRLETHTKKIIGVIQIENFGEIGGIEHRLRHDDFLVK